MRAWAHTVCPEEKQTADRRVTRAGKGVRTMEIDVEKLADAEMRCVGKMDTEDMAALKVCLFSAGALLGLTVKNKFLRRLTGLTCTVLAAGLAVPLASKYLDELREEGEPLVGIKVEKGEEPDTETVFEFKVEAGEGADDAPKAADVPPAEETGE